MSGCMGVHINCCCNIDKQVPRNLFGLVRHIKNNTKLYHKSDRRQMLDDSGVNVEPAADSSVDKTVDKSADMSLNSLYDPTDRDHEHHHERNMRPLPRLGKTFKNLNCFKCLFCFIFNWPTLIRIA